MILWPISRKDGELMYNCDKCGKTSKPKEKCNIVPIKFRTKHYPEGTIGQEIVKEQKICNECNEIESSK